MGSSVRGSIDLVLLLTGLARLRGEAGMARESARDAAYAALSGRIRIADGCDRTPESVIDELLGELWPAGSPRPGRPGRKLRRHARRAAATRRPAGHAAGGPPSRRGGGPGR